MPSPLEVYTIDSFRGGVNDYAAVVGGMREDESKELKNVEMDGLGRLGLRGGISVKDTLQDATTTEIDHVLWLGAFGSGMAAVGFSVSDAETWLFTSTEQDGTGFGVAPAAYATPLYTGATIPEIIAVEITALGSGAPENRLYFCDANANYNLKYWNGTTIIEESVDLDNDGSAAALTPTFVAEYNYHLFIAGFQDDSNITMPETVRFSTPGLQILTDADGHGDAEEWFMNDFEAVGRPGEAHKIMAKASGGLVMIKDNSVHYWW